MVEKINTLSILWRNILNIEQEFFYKVDQVNSLSHKQKNEEKKFEIYNVVCYIPCALRGALYE